MKYTTPIDVEVSPGTAPFVTNSNTLVTNLNADLLDGFSASYFASVTSLDGKQPFHGFYDRTQSSISFNNSTQVATLGVASNQIVYLNGISYNIPSPGLSINLNTKSLSTGLWFIWIEISGGVPVLNASKTAWSLLNLLITPCMTVFWNGSQGAIGEERHGYDRNLQDHLYKHMTIGTRIANDGSFYQTLPTTGSYNQLSIIGGTLWDEDIQNIISSSQVRCRLWYETANSVWTWKNGTDNGAGSDYPFLYSGGFVQFPKSDSSYALTNVSNNNYISVWVYATNDIDRPIAIVTPSTTADYSLGNARNTTAPNPAFSPEIKLLYRWIIRGDGRYQESTDYRTSASLPSGGVTNPTAISVFFSPAGNVTSQNVQAAIQELDLEKENILGNPLADGSVLSSTASGVRSWIPSSNHSISSAFMSGGF